MSIKKFFKFSFMLFIFIILANCTLVHASNIDMNLSNTSDDTVYGSNITTNNTTNNDAQNNSNHTPNSISVGTSSALSSSDLGTGNIINIILIVVGILLILLGIAILIRMR